MNLKHLCSAPHVNVYFDSWNNWLYVEWEGALTLAAVQYACLEVAECFVKHAYPRVLHSDAQVTSLPWEAVPWLTHAFFPYLELAGIEQLAWVHAPVVRAFGLARQVHEQLPHLNIGVFSDLEDATTWLQQSNPAYVRGFAPPPRPLAQETELAQSVANFKQSLSHQGVNAALAARS